MDQFRFEMCTCGAKPIHGYFLGGEQRVSPPVASKKDGREMIANALAANFIDTAQKETLETQVGETALPEEI